MGSVIVINKTINTSENPQKVSNLFDQFFTTIGGNLVKHIRPSNINYVEKKHI